MAATRFGRVAAFVFLAVALAAFAGLHGADSRTEDGSASPLRFVVMDPLSDQLACDCVAGYAQRRYDKLAEFFQERLGRPVEIAYSESLLLPGAGVAGGVDLVFGKYSEVVSDAARAKMNVRAVAMLTGQDGKVTQTGLFVVRSTDPASSLEDLAKHQILFGPEDAMEKRDAALASLEAFDIVIPGELRVSSGCNSAAIAVVEGDADAAVISSYAMPLLEGCGTIDRGALRVVGETDQVPFVGVFATDRVGSEAERAILEALGAVADRPGLLQDIQSRDGFVPLRTTDMAMDAKTSGWPDWRGPRRDAHSDDVPGALPAEKRLLWSRTLTGPGMSGMAVEAGCVVVADKDLDLKRDVFRCLDADTGRRLWSLSYPAPKEMDYTNSPRANPVVFDGLVYLLGAFGDLHCVRLASGEIVWKRQLLADFDAGLPTWGTCSTPLVVDDKLIVNPGAEKASVAALDRLTGEVVWTSPGEQPGYSSFILAELGGRRQIVGYDAVSLGGWDPQSGERLWRLVPEWDGDFNVPTPIVVGDRLLVSTENNGTRLYGFGASGRIVAEPLAMSEDLAPDTSTPVVIDGLVFGNYGALVCLDLADNLNLLWESEDEALMDYCSLVAGNGRVLVMSQSGRLYLIRADRERFDCIATLDLFDDVADTEREVWSHPSLVGNRLYVRNLLGVYCFLMDY
jgi:outer membrane protein assembly factor BamB/ABC-type phosphate/phosphonate transport system substrate-binding protein